MAERIEIHSRNDTFQLLEAAMRNRNKRLRQGFFVVESVKGINLALQTPGWEPCGVVYARERKLSLWAQEILRRQTLTQYILPEALLSELSDREETSEILLLCRIRSFSLDDLPQSSRLLLLTDRTQNPGNLGSIIRSADAMGADALLMVGHSADVYDPACVRATIGTIFTLPVVRLEGVQDLLPLREKFPAMQWVGTSAHGTVNLDEVDLSRQTLLMMGNETVGLSRACKEACDVLARIPIFGAASSLNLACATSICLYEAQRQRLAAAKRGN
ncbi:MAG: TrmH family RNA methyltransferase [Candidatus Spyradocola sp.]|jgi:tRNA G18 (ribose-2'-O)-methylase SpoU